MINIVGILTDPMGQVVPLASIRVTAVNTSGMTLSGSEAIHKTKKDGTYSFELKNGNYLLEINYDDEWHTTGYVLVDDFSPDPLNIEELLEYGTPVIPPISDTLPTDWENLFSETVDGDEWERKAEQQLREGEVYSNEQKNIYKTEEKYLATEDFTQNSTQAQHHNQYLAYSDDLNNFSGVRAQEVSTPKLSGISQIELFESSNGDEHLRNLLSLTGSGMSYLSSVELFNTRYHKQLSESLGSTQKTSITEFSQEFDNDLGASQTGSRALEEASLKTGEDLHEGEIYSKEDIKYVDVDDLVTALFEKGIRLKYAKEGNPVEGFERILADNVNGISKVTQANKTTLQGLDGEKLLECDTDANTVNVYGKLVVQNPEDFKGEDGSILDWTFEYSSDKGDDDPWHEEWVTGDIWRKDTQQRLYADGTSTPTGVVEYVKLTAEDGHDGDTYYLESQYSADEDHSTWHDTYAEGDIWRRQRQVAQSEVSAWWEPERIRGDEGQDGWTPEYETYYGVDGTAPFDPINPNLADWHKNLSNEDMYKYERTVWWHTPDAFSSTRNASFGIDWSKATEGTYTLTPWLGATKIKPVAGEDYGDKTAPIFLYVRASEAPLDTSVGVWSYDFITQDATNVSGNTGGWAQKLPPAGDEPLWVASGTAFSKGDKDDNIDNWDVDMMSKNGVKYATAWMYQIGTDAEKPPTLPSEILEFNFITQKITSNSGSWSPNLISNLAEGSILWATVAPVTAAAEDTIEPVAVNDWEEAAAITANSYSVFKSSVFKRTNTSMTETPPTGGSYDSPVPTGWSDGVPAGEAQLWISTRIFTSTGSSPQQDGWTTPQIMTDTASIDYEWSVSGTGNPTDNPTEWSNTADENTVWMAVRTKSNGVWSAWDISKIKGERGDVAELITLTVDSQVFKWDGSGNGIGTNTITFQAETVNIVEELTWTTTPSGITLTGSGSTRQLTREAFGDNDSISVEVSAEGVRDIISVYRLTDGRGGDTLYYEYQYSANGTSSWHDDLAGTDYYRRERTVTVTPEETSYSAWTTGVLIRKDGAKGEPAEDGIDGVSIWTSFEFSATGVGNPDTHPDIWSSTQRSTDKYIISQSYTNSVGAGWSEVTKIKGTDGINGTDGIDGLNGDYVSYVYITTSTTISPIKPQGGTYNGITETIPTNWSDNPLFEEEKITWVSTVRYAENIDGSWERTSDWTTPVMWSNTGKFFETRYFVSEAAPNRPTVAEPTNWSIALPEATSPKKVWASSCTKHSTGELDVSWSEPIVWNHIPEYGVDYVDGVDGSFVSYIYKLSDTSETPVGGTYNGTTESIPSGWLDNPVYSSTTKTQVSTARYVKSGAVWVRNPDWSASVQYLGVDGSSGDTIYIEYEYSVNGSAPWSTDFLDTHYYRREQTVMNGTGQGWSSATRIREDGVDGHTPIEGIDYFPKEGAFRSWIYTTSVTQPSTPTGGSFTGDPVTEVIPTGWADNPYFTGGQITWVSSTTYDQVDPENNTWVNVGWSAAAEYSKQGDTGISIYYEYQYSVNGTGSWHNDLTSTDYFRRERTVTVTADDTTYSVWTSGSRIREDGDEGYTPVKGVDYFDGIDGSFTSYIYKLSDTSLTPVGGSFDGTTEVVPSGWSDSPVYSATTKTQVSTARYVWSGVAWVRDPNWSTSVQYLGVDGEDAVVGFLTNENHTVTTDASGNGGDYSSAGGDFVVFDGLTEAQGVTFAAKDKNGLTCSIHSTTGAYTITGSSKDTATVRFEATYGTVVISQRYTLSKSKQGEQGESITGEAGKHGAASIQVIEPVSSNVPSKTNTTTLNSTYKTVLGLSSDESIPKGAIITYISGLAGNNSSYYTPVSYLCAAEGGGTWEDFVRVSDGNEIIHGTLAAEALIAESITGDQINATARIEVGKIEGQYVVLSGNAGTDYAIFAGANKGDTGEDAPFRVGHNGELKATKADIEGKVKATSGSFQGRVEAGDIYIPNTTSPKFKVDSAGKMTCSGASINGTLNGVGGTFTGSITADQVTGATKSIGSGTVLVSALTEALQQEDGDENYKDPTGQFGFGSNSVSDNFGGQVNSNSYFIETGIVISNWHVNYKPLTVSVTRTGTWTVYTNHASDGLAGGGTSGIIVPVQKSKNGLYSDATLWIRVDMLHRYSASQASSSLTWNIYESLLPKAT